MHGYEDLYQDFFSAFGIPTESFECTLDIYEKDSHRTMQLNQPCTFIQSQFINLMQQAGQTGVPVKIKLSRIDKIWDQFEQRFVDRDNSITFKNNAWRDAHREEEE